MAEDIIAGETILARFSSQIGATEPALRLLISILIGYPIALIHRYTLYRKSPNLQHIFFIICGFSIGYFNYGQDIFHSLATIMVVYASLLLFGACAFMVMLVFTFCMAYLLFGYLYASTDSYDICWTMPQCCLTLRLIGLAFDIYDGSQREEKLGEDQKKTRLEKMPNILEVAAHCYFPASFMVGPQFPMRRYQSFIRGDLGEPKNEMGHPNCLQPAFMRAVLGFAYLAFFQLGSTLVPNDVLLSEQYQNYSFVWKLLVLGFWGKITLYKYISCWLLAEGVCIATGLTYNGMSATGEAQWDGCRNVNLKIFEGATKFGHYIPAFNINTNHWVGQYVYKRLKFLGNRYISQLAALLFLAIWHGLHSGYYMTFLMEFIILKFERDFEPMLEKNKKVQSFFYLPYMIPFTFVMLKLYTIIFMGFCMVPFGLLVFSRWWQVYRSVYFVGYLAFMTWPLTKPIVKKLLPPAKDTHSRQEKLE